MSAIVVATGSAVSVPADEWNRLVELRASAVEKIENDDAFYAALKAKDKDAFAREQNRLLLTWERFEAAVRAVIAAGDVHERTREP